MLLSDLFESRSAPLYHWIIDHKLEWMLEHDEMLGKWDHYIPVEGKNFQGNSFSRNSKLDLDHCRVRLTVDQEKLASKFKIIPTDGSYIFHGRGVHTMTNPTDRKARLGNLDHLRDRTFLSDKGNFSEEFVVGDIKEIHRYITEIRYYRARNSNPGPLPDLLEYGKKFNLKIKQAKTRADLTK